MTHHCPVCELGPVRERQPAMDAALWDCERCGRFVLTDTAESALLGALQGKPLARPTLSHFIRKRQVGETKPPKITSDWTEKVLGELSLPSPGERIDNLILAIGEKSKDAGETVAIFPNHYIGLVGASSIDSFKFIVETLVG